ncbi:MAG: nickel pincer cofactor biosynthesis protein LarC [Gemmatimonadetes bacterium]|nr:nickel pincer cofactor biosynthesis protein LarC [Gemmatimonadota bacterium]
MPGAIFDPFSGISGDMVLGALLDLGLPLDFLRQTIGGLGIEAGRVEARRVRRAGIAAWKVDIPEEEHAPARHLADVLEIIDRASLSPRAKALARDVFERLARAEAAVHGSDPEHVHFHEVGAVDSIADIVGAAAGFVELGIGPAYTRAVPLSRGWISGAHGALPTPAPATVKLLEGLPTIESPFEGEIVTPTGAALLAAFTGGKTAPGTFRPIRSGFGAGSRDPADRPNCLRIILIAESTETPSALLLLQADVDDMAPEFVPPALEALAAAGALEVWVHPVSMKKGRPAIRIEALVPAERRPAASEALFVHTTTLGLRFWAVDREILSREILDVTWRGYRIRVKRATLPGGGVRFKPEYEDIMQMAQALGVPPLQLLGEFTREFEGA